MFQPVLTLFSAKRITKRVVTVCYDIIAISAALYFAIVLRTGKMTIPFGPEELTSFTLTIVVTLLVFAKLGLYRAVLRYMIVPALGHIALAVILSAFALAISSFYTHSYIHRSVPAIYAGLAVLLLGAPRVLIRMYFDRYYRKGKPHVLIYGAGSTGRELAYALRQGSEYHPVAMLDDNRLKCGNIIYGLKVYHSSEFETLNSLYRPVKLLLAINNISKGERLRILEKLSHWPIEIQSVPSVEDIASGKSSLTEIKDLDVADLLGRDSVAPQEELMKACIESKAVMVTGAGGSIGSELCRQIIKRKPKLLLLFELNEYNLYNIERELQQFIKFTKQNIPIIAALGSVQHKNRLQNLMANYHIDTVYHAAAYKHVPIVEHNTIEGIRNNIFGTLFTAEAAMDTGVSNFVLISTDKAVRPTNVMGASKRMAELVLQALAGKQSGTTFTMVRFGNVLGSSGSVVPLFREQIKKGGPVTVTHPDITRYFMLIPEAAQLVIQAGAIGHNGQVFVLDMNEPVKILDLAKRMIQLMGLTEKKNEKCDGDIEIRYTGLRPGEKLYEELLIGENVTGTTHPKIMTAKEEKLSWPEMEAVLEQLDEACHTTDLQKVRNILLNTPTGYRPDGEIYDHLFNQYTELKL
ncbi:polysaccharide biosynthesis protein [Photobacterium gaetbulicola]|uniref:Putative mannosyl-transferase n=1 Tax=Photobacterium gaetbulicola Gung47 TaxID=658445 RepID=A0A0C5WWV8_9GAMM|nr:nucleoside-diphosphate sugar epimerase/dehydratase [Photobacterium gaetbulicola]AJR09514.1 putative mannosyl-transferase [Photobacterium gaetbulicola Gung47]PSU14309.1 polysaccharide biosynthesis protein [Photobacterium gaetbulicola]